MKIVSHCLIALGLLWSGIGMVSAQAIPTLEFFHGRECPHCQNEKKWFPELKRAYPDLIIKEYEVWHDAENQALMQKRLSELDREAGGVPTNIIGNQVIVGFLPEQILATLEELYGPPAVAIDAAAGPASDSEETDYTWLWIVFGALLLGGVVAFAGKKS